MIKKISLVSCFLLFGAAFAQKTHTVVKGDSAYNISKKYGIPVNQLLQLNPKVKDGKLNIGDVLTISKTGKNNATPAKAETTSSVSTSTGTIVVQPKQTIYGITKQYKISEAELIKLNPGLAEVGLQIGSELTLPTDRIKKYAGAAAVTPIATTPSRVVNTENTTKSNSQSIGSDDDYVTYNVEQGDTVFSIVNKFGITIDQLTNLNPSLSNGLKIGSVLKIKKLDSSYTKKSGDALSVVLMLPFGYSSNDTKYRSMAYDFLTGAKLAIERSAAKGQKLEIKIVDSGSEASFKNSLTQINQENTDLIIGPFFKSNVLDVLDFTKNSKIPVVAPFANAPELYDYSNLIVVETHDSAYADRIITEVKNQYSDQKIYIVADSKKENANYLKAGLEKALRNANITLVSSANDIQLDKNMMTGQSAPVIAILANSSDSVGDEFANKMLSLSEEVKGIKAFSMYYTPMFDKKSNELGQVNLLYLMDRKIDTDGSFEKGIMADYKKKYCKTVPKYAIIGFDIVNDMLSRENKNGEILKQMNKVQTQLATKFEFVRPKSGGAFVNTGYRVIKLIPEE